MTEFDEGIPQANPNAWMIALGCGIFSLIFGLFGVIACQFAAPFALIAGAIGGWFGYQAMNMPSDDPNAKTFGIIGMVLGIIGAVLGIIGSIILLTYCGFIGAYCGCIGCFGCSNDRGGEGARSHGAGAGAGA